MSPSRDTSAGSAFLDLQREARATNRPTQELLQLYVLEAFLDRLSRSDDRADFILKGGVLLAAFDVRRPTRDIDFQAEALTNEADEVLARIRRIAARAVDDGVEFDTANATAVVIRDEDEYSGVRVSMPAALATARLSFHVDISVGDPIVPAPNDVELPRLLGGSISVRGYPLSLVHAEKIVTAIARGTVNTRWRDFMDVVVLARAQPIDGTELVTAVGAVSEHRHVPLVALAEVLDGYGDIGQARWAAWRKRQGVDDRTPEQFSELIAAFIEFAEPAVSGEAAGRQWNPRTLSWE